MKIKAVLFDLDDTLYGEFPECDRLGYLAAGRYVEQRFGIPAETFGQAMRDARDTFRAELHEFPESHDRTLSAQRALERLQINPLPHAKAIHDAYWDTVIQSMRLRDGVIELLQLLHDNHIPVGVCTNMLADMQMKKLCHLGLADLCGPLISSEEAGRDKPHPPIFRLALKKLNASAEETLMVGDSFKHDMVGAVQAGMHGLWLNLKKADRPIPDLPIWEAYSFPEAAAQVRRLCQI